MSTKDRRLFNLWLKGVINDPFYFILIEFFIICFAIPIALIVIL